VENNLDQYSCTFGALISTWRRRWADNSGADEKFPFGFVQLASFKEDYEGYEFPVLRWHQTSDLGFVPNPMERANVFMAVGLDTHDPESGIHPRDKQVLSLQC